MSSIIAPPKLWKDVDIGDVCANWTLDAVSTNRRMGNRAVALKQNANAVNHLLARTGRPLFGINLPYADADTTGANPLFRWAFYDDHDNGTFYTVYVIFQFRTAGSGVYYAAQWSGAGYYNADNKTADANATVTSVNHFADCYLGKFQVTRGTTPTDALAEDGLSTVQGATVLSLSVMEDNLDELDTGTHVYCDPTLAGRGEKVLEDAQEDIRAKLHTRRSTALPIVDWWSAVTQAATPSVPGDHTGYRVTSTSYVNLQDQSIAARAASSPGCFVNAYHIGVGPEGQTAGRQVKLRYMVLAEASTANGYVKFEGSDSFTNNYTEITVTAGAGFDWYGDSTNFLYLDTAVEPWIINDTVANKIDRMAKVDATGDLIVRGWCGWIEYG